MKDINKELILFLEQGAGSDDLDEIVFQLQSSSFRSLRLVPQSQTKTEDADFIFNNQQYKKVVTRKLPLFKSTEEYDYLEGEDDFFDGNTEEHSDQIDSNG